MNAVTSYVTYNYGAIASVLSLVVTVLIWIKVRRINGRLINKFRLPELNNRLTELAGSLSKELIAWDENIGSIETDKLIGQILVCVTRAKKMLPRDDARLAQDAIKAIRRAQESDAQEPPSKESLQRVQRQLYAVVEVIQNVIEERSIETRP